MNNFKNGQYVICGGADQYWTGTGATTVRGAKNCASRAYQQAPGGKIEIAQVSDEQYVPIAVKYGYGKWQGE